MRFATAASVSVTAMVLSSIASSALADTTGPGATLFKLSDRWVSVLPQPQVVAIAPVPVPAPIVPEPVVEQIVLPEANYSGACHVSVNPETKTYQINATSSTDLVRKQSASRVCLPSEKLAIDQGFAPLAR